MNKSTIHSTNVLGALPGELASKLFSKARVVALKADQALFMAGDEGNGCYRVDEGLLKASVSAPNGSERILAIFGPSAVVGELSMIDGAPRSASVFALRDSRLSFVSRTAFETFGQQSPELWRHVLMLLAGGVATDKGRPAGTTVFLVGGRGGPGALF